MQIELPDLIRILPPNIFQLMIDIDEDCSKDVPTKTVSSHSKILWNAKLSDLLLQNRGPIKKIGNNFTPWHRMSSLPLRDEMKVEVELNKNLWTEKTNCDFNEKNC